MMAIEDELRELGTAVAVPALPDAEELVRRAERHRRQRRVTSALGCLAFVALTSALVVALERIGGSQQPQVATEGPSSEGTSPQSPSPGDRYSERSPVPPSCDVPDVPPDVAVEELSGGGVPAVLVAASFGGGDIAAIDLDKGCRAVYPSGSHPVEVEGQPDSAVLTDDELVAWGFLDMPTLAFPAGRMADGHHQLVAGGLQEQGREVRGPLGFGRVLPTDSGDALWLETDDDVESTLELIDVETGDVLRSVPVDPMTELVGVAGEDAVVVPANPPATKASFVSPSGEATTVELPELASFVGVSSTHTFWIVGGGQGAGESLLVVSNDDEDDTTSIPVPEDQDGRWVWLSYQSDPGTMGTVNADGTRLLVALSEPDSTLLKSVAVVDIEKRTTDVIYDGSGFAFWAQDGRTAVIVDDTDVTSIDTFDRTGTTIEDAVPFGEVVASR